MQHTLYRAVRRRKPSLGDFWSDFAHGDAPSPPQFKDPLLWAGISTYADPGIAARRARAYGQGLYLAELRVDDEQVIVKQTGRDPRHFSLMASPSSIRSMVEHVLPMIDVTG